MLSDDVHKQLVDRSQNKATIPLAKRYGVHFEYEELVAKLEAVILEKELDKNTPQPSKRLENQESTHFPRSKLVRSNTQGKTKSKNCNGFTRSTNSSLNRFQNKPKVPNLPKIPLAPSRVNVVFPNQEVLPYLKHQRFRVKQTHLKLINKSKN